MKPSIGKVIKYDYFSTLLFIVSLVATLLFIAIAFSNVNVWEIIIPIILVSYTLLILRVYLTRKLITKLKDSRIKGVVHKIDQNNGNFYIVVNYEVRTRSMGKRIPILAGPVLRAKLRKLKEVELLMDLDKPKKIFIAEFYYE
jgi:hypothetical protein